MQLINIYPVANICMEFCQPMHMFLTHLIERNEQYAITARKVGGYKILDNSLIELGSAVPIKRILEAAERINADEIILPDVFQDGKGTLEAVRRALIELDRIYAGKWPYKLMAVAQGSTFVEWRQCYEALLNMIEVDVIGIPKVCAKMLPGGRPAVLRHNVVDLLKKPHHLLGLWYSASELLEYDQPAQIRSCDTVLASFMAKWDLRPFGVRPDGYTIDLEKDVISPEILLEVQQEIQRTADVAYGGGAIQ